MDIKHCKCGCTEFYEMGTTLFCNRCHRMWFKNESGVWESRQACPDFVE